jgi:hypothetical protein
MLPYSQLGPVLWLEPVAGFATMTHPSTFMSYAITAYEVNFLAFGQT